MVLRLALAALAAIFLCLSGSAEAARGCGSNGGPGYRGPDGRCVGWADLGRVCGSPPTTRCTAEKPNAASPLTHPRKPAAPPKGE